MAENCLERGSRSPGFGLKGGVIRADIRLQAANSTGGVRPGVLMRSLPLTTRALIVLTVAAAALLTGYAALALPAHGNHLWWVAFLCAAMGGEALRVSSDGESGAVAEFTFSMAVLVAAVPLFGPVVASVISFASLAAVDIARGERLYRLMFNASTYALAGAAAGWVFLATGGHLGQISDTHPGPLAAAVATHAVVTTGLIGIALASARRVRLVAGTLSYAREVTPTSLAEYSLGLVLARLCAAAPGFVPLLAPLFIAVYRAHSSAVRLATETKQALRGLADIVDARDPYTFAHSERVADYATRLAEALDLPDWRVNSITRAGRLHDLGKLTVDVAILTKPGPLTDAEFDELRAHPAMSARLLAPFSFVASERSLIEYHHERFDGNGYYRIPRERLPIYAHFLILADSWDAMTSDRPYRRGLSPRDAAAEIRKHLGGQFHPLLGRAFLAVMEGREIREELTAEEFADLRAELEGVRDQRFARTRARARLGRRSLTWRVMIVPACILGMVAAVLPHEAAPIAGAAGLAALAGWYVLSSDQRAERRTLRMLNAAPHPVTTGEIMARVDSRLGLIWIGPLRSGPNVLRRAGQGWSMSEHQDAALGRVDALLARTDPGELVGEDDSLRRDGSALAIHHLADGQPMLVVTSGPTLPSALVQVLLGLLMAMDVTPEQGQLTRAA
jgi:HD-GYP domain-containing protein (c-di-GMP phosphodiesterase class II)